MVFSGISQDSLFGFEAEGLKEVFTGGGGGSIPDIDKLLVLLDNGSTRLPDIGKLTGGGGGTIPVIDKLLELLGGGGTTIPRTRPTCSGLAMLDALVSNPTGRRPYRQRRVQRAPTKDPVTADGLQLEPNKM